MSTIMKLVQGSAEWHEHRRKHRNASETPVVLGVSPWQTPYQLWQAKLGLVRPEVTSAMLRGTELEPAARAVYEARTALALQPLVLAHGPYSAPPARGARARGGPARGTAAAVPARAVGDPGTPARSAGRAALGLVYGDARGSGRRSPRLPREEGRRRRWMDRARGELRARWLALGRPIG